MIINEKERTENLEWYLQTIKDIETIEPNPNQSEFALDAIFVIRNFARRARVQIEENELYKKMILRDDKKQ